MAISIINLDSNSRKIFNKFSGSQEIYFLSHPVILQVATEQNDMLEQRSLQHQREVSTLKNKIKLCQRKLKDAELEVCSQFICYFIYKLIQIFVLETNVSGNQILPPRSMLQYAMQNPSLFFGYIFLILGTLSRNLIILYQFLQEIRTKWSWKKTWWER